MPAAPADNALYAGLFGDADTARLFTASAEIRAMLLVEGMLAKTQGELGLIPADAAAFIHRASHEVQIDPEALAEETQRNGVPVPGLVNAFRAAMKAPDLAAFVHWGATSQDIMDTGLMLRLKRVTELWRGRLDAVLAGLADLAKTHAELPMAARTYGQTATLTSFGAVCASWGRPLLAHRARLDDLRPRLLMVSLGGAAGTLSAMGPEGGAVRARLAALLGLGDPGHSWHSERETVAEFAAWIAGLGASLGKMGEDLILMTQSGIDEVTLDGSGGSSTMPQKQNPVGPSVLAALGRHNAGLAALMQGAHRQNRDGAAWFSEWLTLPQMCISTGRALALACELTGQISPQAERMAAALNDGSGLIHAEALSFALAGRMGRPEAQARVKAMCAEATATGQALLFLAARDFPGQDWPALLAAAQPMGDSAKQARRFVQSVRQAI